MCYSTYGDTMKTNIVYTDNKLYVNTSGNIDKDNYNSLKEKVNYIINEYMDMWMLLLLVFVMIFLFLYLTYNLLSSLKTVVIANKYIRKGGNNENKKRS